MTVAGLVSHLRWVEHCWFEVLFLGGDSSTNPQFGDVEDADFQVGGVALNELLAAYADQCARSNAITAEAQLDDPGRHPDFGSGGATLRWMLHHMLEEVARHVGQLDVLRELIDGRTGYW